jgi:HK97 family phage portal protein
MNLKALWPFGRKSAEPVVRVLNLTEPDGWPVERTYSGADVTESSVLALSAAWACVNLLAGTIASLPLMVYRTDAKGRREVARDHPLYRILHDSPNYDQTAMDFWEGGVAALELRGNMHARKEVSGGRLVALHPVWNPTVTRMSNGSLRYRWTENGKSYDEPQESVLHVRGFGGSPLGGLSTLTYGRQVFGLSVAANQAAGSMFANGVRSTGVLTAGGPLTKEQFDETERRLGEKFSGAMNAGRPMLLAQGMSWQQITMTPEDAQMLESRAFSVEEVCRLYGVPPHMIGHTEKSTSWGTGLEQQTIGFVKFTLRKRLKRIEQALEKQLLTAVERAQGYRIEFNLEGLLRGDSGGRASFYQSALTNGWMTINEVRALENMAPVEGGDTPRMQMQNVPITEAGQAPAPAAEEA